MALTILAVVCVPAARAATTEAPLLLRLFLTGGGALVSYGEYSRTPDLVVFAMPVGGPIEEPHVQVVSLPAAAIDWPRTEKYAAGARYHHYAATRGEEEYRQLTDEVARTLNLIASTTDPAAALQIAGRARLALLRWPQDHYDYRARDIEEIVWLIDESIGALRAKLGVGAFDVALTARTAEVEPVGPPPDPLRPLDVLNGMLAAARVSPRSADRLVLLQAAAHYLEAAKVLPPRELAPMRKTLRERMLGEQRVDARYAKWSAKVLRQASAAAARGRVGEVQTIASRILDDDRRMGQARPDVVGTVLTAVRQKAEEATTLRLQQDRRLMNRSLYTRYARAVGPFLQQIEKLQPVLEQIRRQEGPAPAELTRWMNRLAGGGNLLDKQSAPDGIAGSHGMLVGAWHLAEQALRSRQAAVAGGSTALSTEASSAAAGALLLIRNAQREHHAFVDGLPTR
ncbi:MAG: hypothetical protein AB7I25_08110 [Vicinamibacterales bacterium]